MNRIVLLLIQLFVRYFSQALNTLDLSENEIGDQGAQHLANALEQNKVRRLGLLDFQFN
jgi:Ran GTPase-activating protein (RanGAP) involved in mRNA processing and transport